MRTDMDNRASKAHVVVLIAIAKKVMGFAD
jgi:hypothetical protein